MAEDVWVTEESNKELWDRLMKIWIGEKHPKYVVQRAGGDMWEVFRVENDEIRFLCRENKTYYEQTGI